MVDNTPGLLVAAVGLQERARISFWDALVVQAALDAECDRLYSEDLNAGRRFGSLLVVNPFAQTPERPASEFGRGTVTERRE